MIKNIVGFTIHQANAKIGPGIRSNRGQEAREEVIAWLSEKMKIYENDPLCFTIWRELKCYTAGVQIDAGYAADVVKDFSPLIQPDGKFEHSGRRILFLPTRCSRYMANLWLQNISKALSSPAAPWNAWKLSINCMRDLRASLG